MPKITLKNIISPPPASLRQDVKTETRPADFETAITATGFGKYNLLLILIAMPCGWASIFETTTMSYVFPAAQCDLELTLEDKGLLNAVTYAGMISSAMIWGFLYDTLGRKKLLMLGYLLDGIFVLMSSSSQSKTLLMISKYLGGFIINGPFAAFISYMSEFQSAANRARMQLVMGLIFSLGAVMMPLLAWLIIPQPFDFTLFSQDWLKIHSWNVYLLITAVPSILSTVIFIFMPESPKFLMTVGQNEKAMLVFKKVYSMNTGKPMDTYPITELVDEIKQKQEELKNNNHGGQVTANRSKAQALKEGWQQIQPLFYKPHLRNIILVCLLESLLTMSLNTLRLWLPQIFQAINDYEFYHNGTSASLCEMIGFIQPQNVTSSECLVNTDNASVYINSIVVSGVQIVSYVFAGYFINKIGKKPLTCCLSLTAGVCACAIYFATNTTFTLISSSIFVTAASIATNVIIAVIIDLFPTTLRTMAVSLAMMFARSGAMGGNILFPILLRSGCAPPFFSIGSLVVLCGLLALLLPNTDFKPLQ